MTIDMPPVTPAFNNDVTCALRIRVIVVAGKGRPNSCERHDTVTKPTEEVPARQRTL
jgi:hypothetical protein